MALPVRLGTLRTAYPEMVLDASVQCSAMVKLVHDIGHEQTQALSL